MREEGRKSSREGAGTYPTVKPKSDGGAIPNRNRGMEAESRQAGNNVLPNRSVEMVGLPQVAFLRPTILSSKPEDPRSGVEGVKFGEEL